jgi:hypothetical protein
MNPHPNLPLPQRHTQRLVEQFNASERLWQSLAGRRKLRRQLRPNMSVKRRTKLDLLDFGKVQPPADCISESDDP